MTAIHQPTASSTPIHHPTAVKLTPKQMKANEIANALTRSMSDTDVAYAEEDLHRLFRTLFDDFDTQTIFDCDEKECCKALEEVMKVMVALYTTSKKPKA